MMRRLVARSAQTRQLPIPELNPIAIVRLDVVDDFGNAHEANSKATLTQGLTPKLMAPQPAPLSAVVGTAAGVAALAAALWMQAGEGIEAHRDTLIRPQNAHNWSTPEYSTGVIASDFRALHAVAILLLLVLLMMGTRKRDRLCAGTNLCLLVLVQKQKQLFYSSRMTIKQLELLSLISSCSNESRHNNESEHAVSNSTIETNQ
jgi:hypothetical protein